MVGEMAACWDKRMVVMMVGSSVDEMVEEVALKRDG